MKVEDIIQQAKKQRLCEEWYNEMLSSPTLETLCRMFFKGDDWALKNNFPSEKMLYYFRGETEQYGLFLDAFGKVETMPKMAFFGYSNVELNYGDFSVSSLILRGNSKGKITAKDYSVVFVTVLDNAEVVVEEQDHAKVKIFRR
ncbi:hypothetical protein [Riemerella anatipestifer]|uniref:hypothetical protein n=1 Tax=Riemerella anatipestifer TaxID=34085 RepID=UPI0021F89493|nr:hypothetical protein [Riemerella anatipestifer]MCW0507940.1 hypothetical protein [Riemerella anatipestifer]